MILTFIESWLVLPTTVHPWSSWPFHGPSPSLRTPSLPLLDLALPRAGPVSWSLPPQLLALTTGGAMSTGFMAFSPSVPAAASPCSWPLVPAPSLPVQLMALTTAVESLAGLEAVSRLPVVVSCHEGQVEEVVHDLAARKLCRCGCVSMGRLCRRVGTARHAVALLGAGVRRHKHSPCAPPDAPYPVTPPGCPPPT